MLSKTFIINGIAASALASIAIGCGATGQTSQAFAQQSFVQLPSQGPGYYAFVPSAHLWGTAKTVSSVQTAGMRWKMMGYDGAYGRIGVNDISLQNGGTMSPHSSHKTGRDVDLRAVRTDAAEAPVTVTDSAYSHANTLVLISDVLQDAFALDKIYFNDSRIYGVSHSSCAAPAADGEKLSYVQCYPGHHNHIHVTSQY